MPDVMDRSCGRQNGGREGGFSYIALLIFIAIMGVELAAEGEVWHMTVRREKEQQLLFVGHQFRNAIVMYYRNTPAMASRYPTSLQDLLKDPRYPATRRYLRKIYADPLTDTTEWGLIKGANGEIMGVFSKSEDAPAKQSNFDFADRTFEGKDKYSDWVFMIAIGRNGLPATGVASGNGLSGQMQQSGNGVAQGSTQNGPIKAF